MSPIDPVEPVHAKTRPPMAPPFVDEDVNMESVQDGMDAAEDDTRDAITDAYEAAALQSEDPEEELDDIDYTATGAGSGSPELDALRETPPEE
ncbi:MAG: hypothetical protein WED15_02530 [Akkermansiaceae bacterium]